MFPVVDSLHRVPALYITETHVELERTFGDDMLAEPKQEKPYAEIIDRLADPKTPSTWIRVEGIFKLQGNALKIHRPHRDGDVDQELPYWLNVVPQGGELRSPILSQIHAVRTQGTRE